MTTLTPEEDMIVHVMRSIDRHARDIHPSDVLLNQRGGPPVLIVVRCEGWRLMITGSTVQGFEQYYREEQINGATGLPPQAVVVQIHEALRHILDDLVPRRQIQPLLDVMIPRLADSHAVAQFRTRTRIPQGGAL